MLQPVQLQPALGELFSLIAYIEAFAELHEIPPAQTMSFSLAAEELFANTINHSHPAATSVTFSMELAEGNLVATYSDDGSPFDPTAQAAPDTTLPAEERTIGGLGIHLIRKTMTIFTYARQDGRNVVTFGRPLQPAAK